MKKKSSKIKFNVNEAKKPIAKNKIGKSVKPKKSDPGFQNIFNSLGDSEKKAIAYYNIKDSKKITTLIKWLEVAKKIYKASKIIEDKDDFNAPKAWLEESENLVADIAGIFKGEDGKGVTVIIIGEMFKKEILIKRPRGCSWNPKLGEPTMETMILLQDKNNNDIQKAWRQKSKKENIESKNQLTMF